MGRYIERAENVARILDVNHQGVIENTGPEAEPSWWSVVATTGDAAEFFGRYPRPTERNVTEFLALDRENPNSVARCVTAARENARSIRDRLSIEELMLDGPYAFSRSVRNGSHLLDGVVDNTMPHDEGWLFLRAGRFLE